MKLRNIARFAIASALVACGSSRDAESTGPTAEGPGSGTEPGTPPTTEATPEAMPSVPTEATPEAIDDGIALDPMAQPPTETPPAVPEVAPPAVCTEALAPLAAFDCGAEGIVFENNGPAQNRVTYMILGDGYTADMLDTVYREHVQNMLTGTDQSMFSQIAEPYLRYRKFINVCALKVASNDACIDDNDTGQQCDSFFNTNGDDESRLARLGQNGQRLVDDTIARLVPEEVDVDWVAVTVNAGANNWWNSGGRFMLWNGSYEPRRRSASVALHEGGHAFHGLADEYGYGSTNCDGSRQANQPNVSNQDTGQKWQAWLGFDHSANNPDGTGAVGTGVQDVFEGAVYCETNYFRPSDNSQMNQLPDAFNMPSIDRIIRDIYALVDPVDDFTDNSAPLVDPTEIRVRVIDPAVLKVDWSVDGTLVGENAGGCFDATELAAGEHSVSAHVYDDTPWVRSDRSDLEQTLTWTVNVQATP